MSHPEWLSQVQAVTTPSTTGSTGKSETGVALGAIADAMQRDDEVRFAAGEVVGVVVQRSAGAQYSVAVSSGDNQVDVQRLAQLHGADVTSVSLVPAAQMLTEQYQGVAPCMHLAKESVPGGRVTLDGLEYLLQKKRAEGVAGDTVVAITGLDNNGRAGAANFEVIPRTAHVAKAEFEKPWSIARFVSRGGVIVLVLG